MEIHSDTGGPLPTSSRPQYPAPPPFEAGRHARDYCGIARQYAEDVVAGKIVACKYVRLACERHLRDLGRALIGWDYWFSRWHGDDICGFIEKLPHVEGSWATSTLRLEPVQIFILSTVFGWRRRVDSCRRFTMAYLEVARKAAKSTLSAGVALYCLTCDGEPGPQIPIAATTGDQAKKVFEPARQMVLRSPWLREDYGCASWARSITCEDNGGFIQTINAKASTQDGWNPHCSILDELHAHKDRALYDVLRSAEGARKNYLQWMITTAGFNLHGVCYEQRSFVVKVLEGAVEAEHYFGIIFTVDEGDDPFDEKNWPKANPMIGITPSWDAMRRYAIEARNSPSAEGEFKTKRLNIWLNASSAWLNTAQWKACGQPDLKLEDFKGLDCWIGGDLADKDDITALVLAAYADGTGRFPAGCLLLLPLFWLPEAVLLDANHSQGKSPVPYRTWVEQGHLILTPGDWVDHNTVEAQVEEWIAALGVRKITFDQFAAAQAMASRLNEKHATPDEPLAVILHKKAATVTDPAKEFERRVKAGPAYLRHNANPVMTWMASNVVVSRRRDETLLPHKETQMSPNKIDGIDAAINAIEPTIDRGLAAGPSVYEDAGFLI